MILSGEAEVTYNDIPLSKYRRIELRKICQEQGIDLFALDPGGNPPAEVMRDALGGSTVKVTQYMTGHGGAKLAEGKRIA